ncbi:MAG: hypothetical protein LLG09_09175 [Negativicutes bacterium]|nr:hypothetical protein [Negativicutes bacterium]
MSKNTSANALKTPPKWDAEKGSGETGAGRRAEKNVSNLRKTIDYFFTKQSVFVMIYLTKYDLPNEMVGLTEQKTS